MAALSSSAYEGAVVPSEHASHVRERGALLVRIYTYIHVQRVWTPVLENNRHEGLAAKLRAAEMAQEHARCVQPAG